jgi:serine acetyltransferase
VVTKPIPPYSVAGGVPARVMEYYGPRDYEPSVLSESNSDKSG